jgi:hypothetical protein
MTNPGESVYHVDNGCDQRATAIDGLFTSHFLKGVVASRLRKDMRAVYENY